MTRVWQSSMLVGGSVLWQIPHEEVEQGSRGSRAFKLGSGSAQCRQLQLTPARHRFFQGWRWLWQLLRALLPQVVLQCSYWTWWPCVDTCQARIRGRENCCQGREHFHVFFSNPMLSWGEHVAKPEQAYFSSINFWVSKLRGVLECFSNSTWLLVGI